MPETITREQQLEVNIESLLDHIAEFKRPCKACGVQLWFVRHKNGNQAPYTFDGTNHFKNCPKAAEFSRKRPAAAAEKEIPAKRSDDALISGRTNPAAVQVQGRLLPEEKTHGPL